MVNFVCLDQNLSTEQHHRGCPEERQLVDFVVHGTTSGTSAAGGSRGREIPRCISSGIGSHQHLRRTWRLFDWVTTY